MTGAHQPGRARSIPERHHVRSHAELLRKLAEAAKQAFDGADRPWDPRRPRVEAPDLGRGFLDSYALPLHILWTYQDAWAREGFLPTVELDSSRARLLELVAPAPTPGLAAVGLQHFVCRPGRAANLPAGFRVTSPARDGRAAAAFETLAPAHVSFERNSFLPFLPGQAAPIPSAGSIALAAALLEPDVLVPPPGAPLLPQLESRVSASNQGALAQRNAARQRVRALQRAETMRELLETGAIDPFTPGFQALCAEVCAAQALANQVPASSAAAPLSESQEILLTQLGRIARRQPQAMAGFEAALARGTGESNADWTRRLDQTTGFLDALVTNLLQEARDNMVRMHGPARLDRLDRAIRGADGAAVEPFRGTADTGTDTLFLLSTLTGGVEETQSAHLEPGDWLVVSETRRVPEPDGEVTEVIEHRQAVQVTNVRDEMAEGRPAPMSRIVFQPPLARPYRLNDVKLLGNMVPISHGTTVRRTVRRSDVQGRGLRLSDAPLAWLPDPHAAQGRTAAVTLRISGQDWTQVPLSARADAPPGAFFLTIGADGVARIAIGAGELDAPIPPDARIEISYREGNGPEGNRPSGAISELGSAASAIAATFNPLATEGGVPPETVAEAIDAGIGASILDRAVSARGLRRLALSYGSVRQATVLRRARPGSPLNRGRALVVVVSGRGGAALTDAERAALHAYLSARVPPGVTVAVENRAQVDLRARVRLAIEKTGDPLTSISAALARLGVTPGSPPGLLDPDVSALGRDVHLSDLHRALSDLSGVAWVHVEALYRSGERPRRADRIAIDTRSLPLWDKSAGGEPVEIVWEHAEDRG
ncbi:MAG: hypothetical protein AAGK37_11030 [Pseudomonadota bacterium]